MFGTKKIKINVTSTEVIGSVGVEDIIKSTSQIRREKKKKKLQAQMALIEQQKKAIENLKAFQSALMDPQ